MGFMKPSTYGVAFIVIIWGLVFFPPLYRVTQKYGWKRNLSGRLLGFFISPILFSPMIPQQKQVANQGSSSASDTKASPSPSPVAIPSPKASPVPSPSPSPKISPSVIAKASEPSPSPSVAARNSEPTPIVESSIKSEAKASAHKEPILVETEEMKPRTARSKSKTSQESNASSVVPQESVEEMAEKVARKYYKACESGVTESFGTANFSISSMVEKYGYTGFLNTTMFVEVLCRATKSKDGFSSEEQAKNAGIRTFLEVGEAYKRGELFRELIKR
jgi:hypothetical protein